MTKKNLIILISAITSSIFNVLVFTYLFAAHSMLSALAISTATVFITIKLVEIMIPAPRVLLLRVDGKPIWKSKTFWGGFILFALSTLEMITGEPISEDHETIRDLILDLDWMNASKATLSLAIILVRYFDVQKHINSIFGTKEE